MLGCRIHRAAWCGPDGLTRRPLELSGIFGLGIAGTGSQEHRFRMVAAACSVRVATDRRVRLVLDA